MIFYHVKISWQYQKGSFARLHEYDLDESYLKRMVLEPIKNKVRFFFDSKSIEPESIYSLSIYSTDEPSSIFKPTEKWLNLYNMIEKAGKNVTRDFTIPLSSSTSETKREFDMTQVFIVHGHDDNTKLELARIIDKELRLESIILHEQPNGGRTLIEKLERYSSSPGFAFVLFTPDDIGSQKDDPVPKSRARQNVILELGYFIGKLGRDRVCCIYKDGVELPSDISGVVYISFEKKVAECYADIRRELGQAGYKFGIEEQ
jgi:predicted nucleotide-binding protein